MVFDNNIPETAEHVYNIETRDKEKVPTVYINSQQTQIY